MQINNTYFSQFAPSSFSPGRQNAAGTRLASLGDQAAKQIQLNDMKQATKVAYVGPKFGEETGQGVYKEGAQLIAYCCKQLEKEYETVNTEIESYESRIDHFQSALDGEIKPEGFSKEIYEKVLEETVSEFEAYKEWAAVELDYRTKHWTSYMNAARMEMYKSTQTNPNEDELKEYLANGFSTEMLKHKFSADTLQKDMQSILEVMTQGYKKEFGIGYEENYQRRMDLYA